MSVFWPVISVVPMSAVVLLSRRNRDRHPIFLWSQRAGGVRRNRAGRIVCAVEVEHHLAVDNWIRVEESSAGIGCRLAGGIGDHKTEAFFFAAFKRGQAQILSI